MSELTIPSAEKSDITAPTIEPGGTALVLQRHERYERDRNSDNSGSLLPDPSEATSQNDKAFFEDVLAQENIDGKEAMVLFVASDTQYNQKGYRSIETGNIAQNAAIETFEAHGIDPSKRIINLNSDFSTKIHSPTGNNLRPFHKLREPKIFDIPEYVNFLREKYGSEDGEGAGISKAAWAAHEDDREKKVRERLGAEGVHDVVDRTKFSINVLRRYAKAFHASHPNKRLVIWATTHYDTISPLIKYATDTSYDEYIPVDYGGGVVISVEPSSENAELIAQNHKISLKLGKQSISALK
jgi:hypothetical protein